VFCDSNDNLCEPESWLLDNAPQNDYSGYSVNGIGDGWCPDEQLSNYLPNCLAYDGGTNLYLQDCSMTNSQVRVPLTWIPAAFLDKVRSAYDGSQCMETPLQSNNNVWMSDCQADDPNQAFVYDSRTQAILHTTSNLCLDYNTNNYNVYLNKCDSVNMGQQWNYDSYMNLHNEAEGSSACLDWSPGNDGNTQKSLYMNPDCTGEYSQKFFIPSTWMPSQGQTYEFQLEGYYTNPTPTGIWNGQWGAATDEQCSINMLKGVLETCDASMELLLGGVTSIGTLQEIARLVNDPEYGPEYMPGSCCLDNPANSEWFGYYYATSVTYDGQPMECQNRGPWHLGLSEEACSNAGGLWFRNPCYTLQTCVNDRPANGTVGFSSSFEAFAESVTITDPLNQTQCENARQQLGYDVSYPFDVNVCITYFERECDTLWMSVDGLVGDWSDKGERSDPSASGLDNGVTTTFQVGYCKIDGSGTCTTDSKQRRLESVAEVPGWQTTDNIGS